MFCQARSQLPRRIFAPTLAPHCHYLIRDWRRKTALQSRPHARITLNPSRQGFPARGPIFSLINPDSKPDHPPLDILSLHAIFPTVNAPDLIAACRGAKDYWLKRGFSRFPRPARSRRGVFLPLPRPRLTDGVFHFRTPPDPSLPEIDCFIRARLFRLPARDPCGEKGEPCPG